MRSSSVEEAHSEAALLSLEQTLLVTGRLHRVLRPFVLRRPKETVAAELAPKVQHAWVVAETTSHIRLSAHEAVTMPLSARLSARPGICRCNMSSMGRCCV